MSLNPNEAPPGLVAVELSGPPIYEPCEKCELYKDREGCCDAPCISDYRKDGCDVYFVRRNTMNAIERSILIADLSEKIASKMCDPDGWELAFDAVMYGRQGLVDMMDEELEATYELWRNK